MTVPQRLPPSANVANHVEPSFSVDHAHINMDAADEYVFDRSILAHFSNHQTPLS
jgi:hypothetical protein